MASGIRRDALQAVSEGKVKHAHPFTWGVEADYLHVKPKLLQRLAREKLIRVVANASGYWRPVELTETGAVELRKLKFEAEVVRIKTTP
jgi:hypothetical protein